MRTIVVDRWPVLRHGLTAVLRRDGHDVVRSLELAHEAVWLLGVRRDVELLVLGATDRPAVEVVLAARGMPRAHGRLRALVLADEAAWAERAELVAAGADGVVPRASEDVDVAAAVTAIAGGDPSPAAASIAVEPPPLSALELELLAALARGASVREAGARLFIGQARAEAEVASLCRKLGAHGPDAAVERAAELGLLGSTVSWAGSGEEAGGDLVRSLDFHPDALPAPLG